MNLKLGIRTDAAQAVAGGAMVVLAAGEISWRDALTTIDFDVMLFLLGMFAEGQTLILGGYLYYLTSRLFNRFKSAQQLLMSILFGAAFSC